MELDEILKLGVLTGSRYFGTNVRDCSDYDLIVMNTVKLPVEAEREDVEVGSGDHLFGNLLNLKCNIGKYTINFIVFDDNELHDVLVDTTNIVNSLGLNYTTDKEVRHRVFEAVNRTLLIERGYYEDPFNDDDLTMMI